MVTARCSKMRNLWLISILLFADHGLESAIQRDCGSILQSSWLQDQRTVGFSDQILYRRLAILRGGIDQATVMKMPRTLGYCKLNTTLLLG